MDAGAAAVRFHTNLDALTFLDQSLIVITGSGFWYGAWWVAWQPHRWTHQWLVYSHLTWRRRGKADPSSDGLLDRCSCDAGGFQSRPKWWVYIRLNAKLSLFLITSSGFPILQAIIVFMIGFFLYGPQMLIGTADVWSEKHSSPFDLTLRLSAQDCAGQKSLAAVLWERVKVSLVGLHTLWVIFELFAHLWRFLSISWHAGSC